VSQTPPTRTVALPDDILTTVTAGDGAALLAAAELEWSRPIPHCPGWHAAALVGHMGAILAWMATIVATGRAVSRADRETPPADSTELAGWYAAHLDRTVRLLTDTPPATPVWTFSSRDDRRVGWWRRRLAVELAIHRWDAEHAAHRTRADSSEPGSCPAPAALHSWVAAAGVEEFVTEFLPGLLAQPAGAGVSGTLHLHATDQPIEWWIDLDARGDCAAQAGHRKADTALRATTSDLLLWLTNRVPSAALDIIGAADTISGWTALRR
jgi:uncharacterized protein (TIGR03083 family)